ncbi:MAG: hypothetical protein GXO77_06770, partial [Calditrichaeota bacterium]|nr:hypothetical protein [Calditrichota bacterium]
NKLKTGGSWSTYNRGTGKYPSSVFNALQNGVWTTYTSAPYLLKSENLQNYLSKNTLAEVEAFKRFYYPLQEDSAYLTADLRSFTCEGQTLNFDDTLKTEPLKIDGEVSFGYQIDLNSKTTKEEKKLLSFWFVSGDQRYLIDQVEIDGNDGKNTLERTVNFDPGNPMTGYVQIEFPEQEPYVINIVPENASGALAKS